MFHRRIPHDANVCDTSAIRAVDHVERELLPSDASVVLVQQSHRPVHSCPIHRRLILHRVPRTVNRLDLVGDS